MAEIDDLYSALDKADKAGNAGDAREIAAHIRALEGGQSSAPAPATAPSAQPAQEPQTGMVEAALQHGLDSATFGAYGPMAAFIASTASKFGDTPMTYSQARQQQLDYMQRLEAEHPYASGAGTLAGSLVGGVGLVKGGLAAARGVGGAVGGAVERAIASGAPEAGAGLVANAGRLAKGGAAAGVATNALEQGVKAGEAAATDVDMRSAHPVQELVGSGLAGAVAGPIVGGAVGTAARGAAKVRDLVTGNELGGGWRYLSRKLGISPDDLQTALNDYSSLTGGQRASLAQVMDMKQQGVLADIAASKPSAGASFRGAADRAERDLPGQTQTLVEDTLGPQMPMKQPRTAAELELQTAQSGDQFRAAGNMQRTATMPQQDVTTLMSSRDFRAAAREAPPDTVSRVVENMRTGQPISADDADTLRQAVNAWGQRVRGGNASVDSMADIFTNLADRAAPGYRQNIVGAHNVGRLREEGYAAGQALKPNMSAGNAPLRGGEALEGYGEGVARRQWDKAGQGPSGARASLDELGNSRNVQDAISSAYGDTTADTLSQGARALRGGQQALDNIAPGRVRPEATEGLEDAAAAGVAAVHGSYASKMFRAVKAASSARISDNAAGKIADMLTSSDPRQIAAAIGNLRRAGATDEAISALQGHAARIAGNRAESRVRGEPLVVTVRKRAGQ